MARPTRGIGDKWIDVCRLLNRRGAAYIVVGGIAVNLHGHVRATRDLDILVPRDIENTRRILEALAELPYGMARELDAETVDARPITIIGDDPRVDILKSAGSLNYRNAKDGVVTITVEDVVVTYAGLEDLIRSKRTDRDDDKADERRLLLIAKQRARRTAGTNPTKPGSPGEPEAPEQTRN